MSVLELEVWGLGPGRLFLFYVYDVCSSSATIHKCMYIYVKKNRRHRAQHTRASYTRTYMTYTCGVSRT